jgi:hypothetical protein
MTAYNAVPVVDFTSNQQYYIAYLGAQLRKSFERETRPPVTMILEADAGAAWAYAIERDIAPAGEYHFNTSGQTAHLALILDAPFNCHTSVGLEFEHMETCTWGSIAHIGGATWTNGVQANSAQSSVTGYLRYTW